MSDEPDKKKSSVRRQRSIYQVHYSIKRREEMTARPLARRLRAGSPEITLYNQQVAGHGGTDDSKYLGLLQCSNGMILKPIIKEAQRREAELYARLASASEPDLQELRRLVPRYVATTRYCYNGHLQDYIMMEDLAQRMLEPCIMDVKIGRRTWDPLASEEKMKSEQAKYALCKQEYGFCIPGYQVYRRGARRDKYNKEHGKKLHGQAVKDAIRNFLNGSEGPLCRALVLQLLTQLWRVQTWSRRQGSVRLYSASLLLVYDAARLRDCTGDEDLPRAEPRAAPVRRHSAHALGASSGHVSGSKRPAAEPRSPSRASSHVWDELNHNHSLHHNYEDKLSQIKMNYRAVLDQLSYDTPTPNPWGTVKIIDFAHAFFNEEDQMGVDDNFREGVESLVKIFESFLRETDDQVV